MSCGRCTNWLPPARGGYINSGHILPKGNESILTKGYESILQNDCVSILTKGYEVVLWIVSRPALQGRSTRTKVFDMGGRAYSVLFCYVPAMVDFEGRVR